MLLFTLFWGCGETIKTTDYTGYCQEDPEANQLHRTIQKSTPCTRIAPACRCTLRRPSRSSCAGPRSCPVKYEDT